MLVLRILADTGIFFTAELASLRPSQIRMLLSPSAGQRTSTGIFLHATGFRSGRNTEMRSSSFSCSVFEAELQDVIPICHATIAGTRIVGRLTAGYVNALDP